MRRHGMEKGMVFVTLLTGVLFLAGCAKAETSVGGEDAAPAVTLETAENGAGTEPEQNLTEEALPEEKKPEEAKQEETKVVETKTEETQPEEVQPENTQPEEAQPEEAQPEEPQPEITQPEQPQPETAQSEEVQPEQEKPELTGLCPITSDEKRSEFGEYCYKDKAVTYAKETGEVPYYIGRENPEESIDFMKNHKEEKDGVLYLGLPLYLPDKTVTGTAYVAVDDTSVAKIEGNELVGLKQGIVTLSSYDADGALLSEKKYVCTTYNDSKANKESLLSFERDMSRFSNARDPEYWKSAVNTIMDMCYLLEARNFKYDFNGEPEFGVIRNVASNEERWAWTADARTIFEMSRGVCIQVAQLATYMLAGDYEDWGAILSEGNQGHIFNWFYEDGYYYIFDFTQVISDNAWNYYSSPMFRDYSQYVKKCKTIEEIRDYCCNEKLSTEQNYAFYMYSCKGHDELPCNLNTGMSDSNAVLTNTWTESEKIIIGFQDVVMEDLVVLFENENSTKIDWKSYTLDEINKNIPHGIYNLPVEYNYRFDY